MSMNLKNCRVGVFLTSTTPLYTGTVSSYVASTFTLVVTPLTGLTDVSEGMAVEAGGELVRIKTVVAGTGTLTLAENGVSSGSGGGFAVGATVYVYNVRYPLPKYGRIAENVVTIVSSVPSPSQFSNWVLNGVTLDNSDEGYLTYDYDGGRCIIYQISGDIEVAKTRRSGATPPVSRTISEMHGSGISGQVTIGGTTPETGELLVTPDVFYKDYDKTWASMGANDAARSKAATPPIPIVDPQCDWVDVDTDATFDAADSIAIYQTFGGAAATIKSYAWDGGAGATYTGGQTNHDVVVKWSTAGLRYLKLTLTDSNDTVAVRYIPVQVGGTPYTDIDSLEMNWTMNQGWTATLTFAIPPAAVLRHSLLMLVDLDTKDPLFLGYIWPASSTYDFERSTLTVIAQTAYAFVANVFSYPFRLVGTEGDPIDWWYIDNNTFARSVYFLLRWHSNFLELANTAWDATPNDRQDYIRDFVAGTIFEQIQGVGRSAFYGIYGDRFGGFDADIHLLYGATITGAAFDAMTRDLTNDDTTEMLEFTYGDEMVSQVRVSGFYFNSAGDLKPIVITAPQHPQNYGRPTEVPGLVAAKESPFITGYQEMLVWAGRHIGLSNFARTYTLKTLVDIDLTTYKMVDLPSGHRIVIESNRMTYSPESLSWTQVLSGRTFGTTADAMVCPIPSSYGTPVVKPVIDPIPLPVEIESPTVAIALTRNQLFRTGNFDNVAPTWTSIKDAGMAGTLLNVSLSQDGNYYGFVFEKLGQGTDDNFGSVWRCTNLLAASPSWTEILTSAQIVTLLSACSDFEWGSPSFLGVMHGGILDRNNVLRVSIRANVLRYKGVWYNGNIGLDLFSTDFGATWQVAWATYITALQTYNLNRSVHIYDEWTGYRVGGIAGPIRGVADLSTAGANEAPQYGCSSSWLALASGTYYGAQDGTNHLATSSDGGTTAWTLNTAIHLSSSACGRVDSSGSIFYVRTGVGSDASTLCKNGVTVIGSLALYGNANVEMCRPTVYTVNSDKLLVTRSTGTGTKWILWSEDGGVTWDDKSGDLPSWSSEGGMNVLGNAHCEFFEDAPSLET